MESWEWSIEVRVLLVSSLHVQNVFLVNSKTKWFWNSSVNILKTRINQSKKQFAVEYSRFKKKKEDRMNLSMIFYEKIKLKIK